MVTKDEKRLEKLKEILRRKVATHSNPVEVGISDMTWLIEQAEQNVLLREALETVPEWEYHVFSHDCNFCGNIILSGHAPDCLRQRALGLVKP